MEYYTVQLYLVIIIIISVFTMQAAVGSKLGGKIALITGASSGIGAATAKLFSKLGATLAITGRNLENLNAVGAECMSSGSDKKPLIIQADLSNEADTKRIMEETIKKYGRLDILVNNAGILETGNIQNTSLEQYDRVMNTNVRAIYHLTMLATAYLIESQGNIVNISSVNGIRSELPIQRPDAREILVTCNIKIKIKIKSLKTGPLR